MADLHLRFYTTQHFKKNRITALTRAEAEAHWHFKKILRPYIPSGNIDEANGEHGCDCVKAERRHLETSTVI